MPLSRQITLSENEYEFYNFNNILSSNICIALLHLFVLTILQWIYMS